ncbi:hypothetical protein J7S99_17125 [Providencia rettgeri]|nr:hypothetical protein [Providencia rettgeri]
MQFQLVIELNKVCIYQYSCLPLDVRNPHLSIDSDCYLGSGVGAVG